MSIPREMEAPIFGKKGGKIQTLMKKNDVKIKVVNQETTLDIEVVGKSPNVAKTKLFIEAQGNLIFKLCPKIQFFRIIFVIMILPLGRGFTLNIC